MPNGGLTQNIHRSRVKGKTKLKFVHDTNWNEIKRTEDIYNFFLKIIR